jgi:hypothetical protein
MKQNSIQRAAPLIGLFLLLTGGCGSNGKSIQATVAFDFGPTNRPQFQKTVTVPEKSTVLDALRSAFPVATSGR